MHTTTPGYVARMGETKILTLPKDLHISPEALQVFLDTFEGPLDLLLYLIRRHSMDIVDISISQVASQYVRYIDAMQVLNLDLAAEYLLMASMLLEMKSKILLPKAQIADDDTTHNEYDIQQDLIKRLVKYEQFKQAASVLSALPQSNQDFLWCNVVVETKLSEPPLISLNDIRQAWQRLMLKNISNQKQYHIKRYEVSVREYMAHILKRLKPNIDHDFLTLLDPEQKLQHIVVSFIAILELSKDGIISINTKSNQIILTLITN